MSQGSVNSPFKWMNDPIHGHIQLDKFVLEYVDTLQFQRLRELKQLGCAYFVFPGASHNRFEHSIGVCHLAGQMIERIRESQKDLEITDSDVKCIKIAGLLHDLGHGPFSHVFDNEFIKTVKPELGWTHEKGSEMMLDYLIDDNGIDLPTDQINFIKNLITGNSPTNSNPERQFLFDIIANKRNSMDVDKFDYISRDCYNVGIKSSYDFARLMNFNRVIDGELCYHAKEVFNVYEMFHTRYSLFKRVYTHRVGKAVEFMVTDALKLADPILNISDKINNAEEYLYLTDHIIQEIMRSNDPGLEKAKDILVKFKRRDLYKFVDEIIIPKEILEHFNKDNVRIEDIISYQPDDAEITKDDLVFDWLKINYGLQDQNPVDYVKFYSRFNDYESYTIPKNKVSLVVPEQFEENVIRIFARDPSKVVDIQKSFRTWISKGPLSKFHHNNKGERNGNGPSSVHDSTPSSSGTSSIFPITPNPAYTFPSDFANSPPRPNQNHLKKRKLHY